MSNDSEDAGPPCIRCGHNADEHWPEHNRRTTACVMCQDYDIRSTEPDGTMRGICCHPANGIRMAHA